MNKELLKEIVAVWISREVRMKAKMNALLKGITMKEYIENLINKDKK